MSIIPLSIDASRRASAFEVTNDHSCYQHFFWNLIPPVALYRATTYLAGKYIVSLFALPSTWNRLKDGAYGFHYPRDLGTYRTRGRLDRESKGYFQNVKIISADEITLDGVEIHFKDEPIERSDQKWLIFFNPNASTYELVMDTMLADGAELKRNIFIINYRGVGESQCEKPCSFKDLEMDGIAAVEHLKKSGVLQKNIVLKGSSLGAAVALHVNRHYNFPCIVNNAFSDSVSVIPPLQKRIHKLFSDKYESAIKKPQNEILTFAQRIKYSLKDLVGSPLELVARTTYFLFVLFKQLYLGEWKEAANAGMAILKTIGFDVILTVTGALALLSSCFTQKMLQLNVSINEMMREDGDSIPSSFLLSEKVAWLAKQSLIHTGWAIDNVMAWNQCDSPKMCAHAGEKDTTIPPNASLAKALEPLCHADTTEIIEMTGENVTHATIACDPNSGIVEDFFTFIYKYSTN